MLAFPLNVAIDSFSNWLVPLTGFNGNTSCCPWLPKEDTPALPIFTLNVLVVGLLLSFLATAELTVEVENEPDIGDRTIVVLLNRPAFFLVDRVLVVVFEAMVVVVVMVGAETVDEEVVAGIVGTEGVGAI